MKTEQELNPARVAPQPTISSIGGGNGCIHSPGGYHNLVWQSRSCAPTSWTLAFIAGLEILFDKGIDTLPGLVEGLNSTALYDQQGQPWQEATLRAFLQENGK